MADLTTQMEWALAQWPLALVVGALVALRGIDKLAATVLRAELGDVSRFGSPRQLMGFLGPEPSKHGSGSSSRQGRITLAGNRHSRRMLMESAWSYRFPARQTMHLKRKAVLHPRTPKPLPGRPRNVSVGFITDISCVSCIE